MLARKVLLVDDSKSARFVLSKLLQRHNLDVEMVDSAEAALDFLKSEQPDAIFMDHLMPGMDGLAATSVIKNDPATAHIPVVMCTSNDGEAYIKEARSHGALGTLLKPPASGKLEAILVAVNEAIDNCKLSPADGASTASAKQADDVVQSFPSEKSRQLQELVAREMANFEQRFIDRMSQQRKQWIESLRNELEAVDQGISIGQMEKFVSDRMSEQQVEFSLQLAELDKQLSEKVSLPVDFDSTVREVAREISESVAGNTARQAAGEVAAVCAAEAVAPVLEQRLNQFTLELQSRDSGLTREDADRLVADRLLEHENAQSIKLEALQDKFGEELISSPALAAKVTASARETATEIARELAYDSAGEAVAPMLDERLAEVTEKLSEQQARATRQTRRLTLVAAFIGMASAALVYFVGA